jgi:hypothetical protein
MSIAEKTASIASTDDDRAPAHCEPGVTSRRNLIISAAVATAAAVAAPSIASAAAASVEAQPDPILAAIEAHRRANAAYLEAEEPLGRTLERKQRRPRVLLGYHDGRGVITSAPTGKRVPTYAYSIADIERNAGDFIDLEGRDKWIVQRAAELEKDEQRLAKQHAKTKLGKLEAIRDKAYEGERERLWDLIWTRPTTINGLAALLRYCRENQSINELVHEDTWEDALEWTIEAAACALAGLPEPPKDEVVAEVWEDGFELI